MKFRYLLFQYWVGYWGKMFQLPTILQLTQFFYSAPIFIYLHYFDGFITCKLLLTQRTTTNEHIFK